MIRLCQYELIRLVKDKFFYGLLIANLMVNAAMFAGQEITWKMIVQKNFFALVIMSLYVCVYLCGDLDERRIIYATTAGHSRNAIVFAKTFLAAVSSIIQLLIFPLFSIIITARLTFEWNAFISYILLAIGYTAIASTMCFIIQKSEPVVIGMLILDVMVVLGLNSEKTSLIFRYLTPSGIQQLLLMEEVSLHIDIVYTIILLATSIVISITVFKRSDI